MKGNRVGTSPELQDHTPVGQLRDEFLRRSAVLLRSLTRNRSLQFLLALVWILIVMCGYYVVHKPFTADHIINLGRPLVDLAVTAGLALLAGGLGRKALRASSLAPLERLALQAALGWGVLGLLWFLAGLLGVFRSWMAWSILIGGLALTWKSGLAWTVELADLKRTWGASGAFGKVLALVIGLLAGIQLLYALAPPAQWDALMYHLQLPRQYLAAGRFYFIAENPYWGQPPLGELVYGMAQALGRNQTAALAGWALQSIFLLGVVGSAARRSGATSGWIGAFALMAGFSFRWLMSSAYVDGLAALFGYATLIGLLAWIEGGTDRWLAWTGLFAGLALWTKLTAGLLLPVMALCIIFLRPPQTVHPWRAALLPCLVALVVFSPWLVINFSYSGSPLYPQIWPTEFASAQRLVYFARQAETAGNQLLWLPLAATWFGLDGARLADSVTYGWDLGPLLMLLAIPGLIASRNSRSARLLGIWLVCGWAGMALAGSYSPLLWQTRLYMVLLPAAGLAAGYGWQALARLQIPKLRLDRVLIAFIGFVALLILQQDLQQLARQNPARVFFERQSEAQYLESRLGWFPAAMRALGDLPSGSSALFLWEPRGLYAPLNAAPDIWIDRWFLDRQGAGEPDQILGRWRDAGFTHLLINRSGAEFEFSERPELTPQDRRALDQLLAQLALQKDFGGVYQLYALSP